MEKNVLICNFSPSRAARMKKALSPFSLTVREVKPEEYLLPLGYLAGVKGCLPLGGRYEGAGLEEEMVIFAGLTSGELDKALLALRRNGLAGIPLKAVLTETNQYWNCIQLYEELGKEHAALHPKGN